MQLGLGDTAKKCITIKVSFQSLYTIIDYFNDPFLMKTRREKAEFNHFILNLTPSMLHFQAILSNGCSRQDITLLFWEKSQEVITLTRTSFTAELSGPVKTMQLDRLICVKYSG